MWCWLLCFGNEPWQIKFTVCYYLEAIGRCRSSGDFSVMQQAGWCPGPGWVALAEFCRCPYLETRFANCWWWWNWWCSAGLFGPCRLRCCFMFHWSEMLSQHQPGYGLLSIYWLQALELAPGQWCIGLHSSWLWHAFSKFFVGLWLQAWVQCCWQQGRPAFIKDHFWIKAFD